jgi:CHAT domain-containing protein
MRAELKAAADEDGQRRALEKHVARMLDRQPRVEALHAVGGVGGAALWAMNNPELTPRAAELIGEEPQEVARLSPYYWAAFTLSGDWR